MAAKIEEITAKFLKERMRFENDDCDVIIGEASMQVPFNDTFITDVFGVKGPALLDELRTGQEYVFYGKWTSYTNRRSGTTEKQFAFTSFVQTAPVSREAVISYITQHGEGCGVGKARATAMWESFGQEAVETARTNPARVVEALKSFSLKVTLEQAEELAANLQADAATEKAKMNLVTLLEGRGFPKSLATQCLQTWGNKSAQIIRRDPYRLMRFKHCGFKRCDAMWMDLGLSPNKLKRQAYCVWHSLARVNDGSTWFSIDYPKIYLSQTISGTKTDLEAALTLAKRGKIISELKTNSLGVIDSQDGTKRWFAEYKNAEHERHIAEAIVYSQFEQNIESVEYATIERYDGYRFGSNGSVESCWSNSGSKTESWKVLKTDEIKGGYLRVRLRVGIQEYEAVQVAHLILEAFVCERPLDAVACHWDGNPKNNSARNLRWDTRAANEEDKKRHFTHQTGSKNPAAKLTETEVAEIRELYASGEFSTYDLSDKFQISRPVVSKIIRRELWSHV